MSQAASPEAANALLKLLEDSPGQARFILTSSEPGMLTHHQVQNGSIACTRPVPRDSIRFSNEPLQCRRKNRQVGCPVKSGVSRSRTAFLPDEGEAGPLEDLRRRAFDIVVGATTQNRGSGYRLAASFPSTRARQLMDVFTFVEVWLRDLAAATAGADKLIVNYDALTRLKARQ